MRFAKGASIAVLLLAPAAVRAQQRKDCTIQQRDTLGTVNVFNNGKPNQMTFIGGGALFICTDGTRIYADSVVQIAASGMDEFINHVRYTTTDNIVTAGYIRYMENDRFSIAQNNVVMTDRKTGSVVTGPIMNYYETSPTRPESLIQIPSGRPHAVLISIAKSDSTRRDTTIADADAMDITGQSRFHGRGGVVLRRSQMTGYGGEAFYDRDAGSLRLAREARLETVDYTITGDTVNGRTSETDQLEEITALLKGRLAGKDLTVEAPRIRVLLDTGVVNRLIAVGEKPGTEGTAPALTRQASATSQDFRLTADSIDALAPAQKLDKVIAVGHAYSERLNQDLGNANVPALASRDWMRGDTIVATFLEVPAERVDSAGRDREVDTVLAVGTSERATSLYRRDDEKNPQAPPSINYLLARRITVKMKAGTVARVDAVGEVQSMYLQPEATRPQNGQAAGKKGS